MILFYFAAFRDQPIEIGQHFADILLLPNLSGKSKKNRR